MNDLTVADISNLLDVVAESRPGIMNLVYESGKLGVEFPMDDLLYFINLARRFRGISEIMDEAEND